MFFRAISACFILLAAVLVSCAGDNGDDDDSDDADDDTDALVIDWVPCSLAEDAGDDLAECGKAQVPLFWENDDGRTIEVAAKRWLSTAKAESGGQLWLIQGGPGGSGMMTFEPLMRELREIVPEFDLYTIDHRGVGYSSPLSCPVQEAEDSDGGAYIYDVEWDTCLEWLDENVGDAFDGYSTRNAAHDLSAFIDATREQDKSVFVWGGSYGTYLTQRYLLLHPDQADGAIVDSIHAVSVPSLKFADAYNENGKRLLQLCADDTDCASKFDADPWDVLAELHEKIEGGHCADLGVDRYTLSYLLGWLAWYSPINAAVPAFIYRLDRCDYEDMLAIVYMWDNVFNGSGDLLDLTSGWYSQVLGAHVGMSDQYWGPEFDGLDIEQYVEETSDNVLVGMWNSMFEYELYQKWPRYDEPQARQLPATDVPVLMLQGDLDGSTPLEVALPLKDVLNGPNQTWAQFPYSAHGVLSDSWVSEDESVPTCGMAMLAEFLRDPETPPNLSCIDDTLPPPFEGYPAFAQYLFGTDDLWENAPVKSGRRAPIRPVVPAWRIP